ncbi:MAG: hypothetical protein AAF563_11060 [Pseudomonadota bacterium]
MQSIRRVGIAGLLFFASSSLAFAEPMTEQVFLDTHVGNCVAYTGPSTGEQCYTADGKTTYTDQTYGNDSGTWEYRDGEVCVRWSKEAGEACEAYVMEADGSFSATSGYTWQVIP